MMIGRLHPNSHPLKMVLNKMKQTREESVQSKASYCSTGSDASGAELSERHHSAAVVYTLCFGVLSGLCHATIMLIADLPSLDLPRIVWTSF